MLFASISTKETAPTVVRYGNGGKNDLPKDDKVMIAATIMPSTTVRQNRERK